MYYLKLTIKPTSAMTFRKMPSSILHISTYPFIPPTAMSGYIKRLLMMANGKDYPDTRIKDPEYIVMPKDIHILGAYPNFDRCYKHITYRQGPGREHYFKHTVFSQISKSQDENYQLHTWEYLFADKLIGYIVCESKDKLSELKKIKNFGCKIGKEGYGFIEDISEINLLEKRKIKAVPSTLLPADAEIIIEVKSEIKIFSLYRYQWKGDKVVGFIPFKGALTNGELLLDYWTDGTINIPVQILNYF